MGKSLRFNPLFLLVLFFTTGVFAQLPDFNLSVNVQNEVCSGQGTLTFQVSGTAPGASVSYSVFLLPNTTTPVASIITNSLTGLNAGTYLVVATQTLGNASNQQQQQVVIQNQIVNLAYTILSQPDVCDLGGTLTVNVSQGTAVGYEIISGPMTFPLQTSNVFTGLSAGLYTVRVFDPCGEAVVQAHTLFEVDAGLGITVDDDVAISCTEIQVSLTVAPSSISAIAYPVEFSLTVYPASGDPITSVQTITGPNSGQTISYSETMPYFEGEVYSYEIVISDACGNTETLSNTIDSSFSADPAASPLQIDCETGAAQLSNVTAVILTGAPDGYTGPVPQDFTSQISPMNSVVIGPLVPGYYTFDVVGLCGEPDQLEVLIQVGGGGSPPGVSIQEGCSPGKGSLAVIGQYTYIILLSGPAEYTSDYPIDLTQQAPGGTLSLNQLPAGTYTFQTDSSCGDVQTVNAIVSGYFSETQVQIDQNCGSFNLGLYHSTNGVNLAKYWLQKFNAATQQWGSPSTGLPYVEGTLPSNLNSREINNNSINYNLAFNGQFRILKSFRTFTGGTFGYEYCFEVLYEFEIPPGPQILDVYTFNCSPSVFDVGVVATGIPPLIYRITQMNGQPFTVSANQSGVFTGLAAANYNFQVEDSCGNIVNMVFDVPSPISMEISATNLCSGQSGQLSVPYLPFLLYEWTNTQNPGVVLSTTGTLTFDPFVYPQNSGTYQVHVTSSLPFSCIDITLAYTVTGSGQAQAGQGTTVSLCDRPTVDLFDYLEGDFDLDGTWTSADTSLSGSTLNTDGLASGTYEFVYEVTGACSTDTSTVVLNLFDSPDVPLVTAQFGCEGESLILQADGTDGAVFNWTGPNGFTGAGNTLTFENGELQLNGMYGVTASLGDCTSDVAWIEVDIQPVPQATVTAGCVNNRYLLTATVDGIDPATASFTWSGPNQFQGSGNPIDVTGVGSGTYTVLIESPAGCSTQVLVDGPTSVCVFPLGITPDGDGANDNYDLSGFDVRKLQIFNRYGVTVYEQENYIDQWRGQDFKGRDLPAGAYYFLAYLNTGGFESGWVYVNRRH